LAEARQGRGRVVLVAGEPGIGKTRLAQELGGVALASGMRVAWGRCDGVGSPPLWPWREVLRSLALDVDPTFSGQADASHERFRVVDLIVQALAQLAAEGSGFVVIVDDAHWADPASLLLLRHLVARAAGMYLLLVVCFRAPEPNDELQSTLAAITGLPAVERIELRGFSIKEVGEQLAVAQAPADRAPVVHEVTRGNPFFVRELANAMAAGAWDVGQPPPRTVLEVVGARVGRLSAPCQQLLGLAAVAGRELDLQLLASASGRSVKRCMAALDEAREHGVVEHYRPPAHMRFVHALLQDALTAALDERTRASHHKAIAEAIEAQCDAAEHAAALAEHWTAAAPLVGSARARTWSVAAADEAVRRLAYEDGVRLYRAALLLGAADGHQRCRLLLRLGRAAFLAGDLNSCANAAREAGAIADALDDAPLLAQAALAVEASTDQQVNAAARSLCDRALSRAEEVDVGLRARLLAQRSHIALYDSELELMRGLSEQALTAARAAGNNEALIEALRARQEARPGADGRAERAQLAEEMVIVGERAGDARAAMWGHLWAVDTLVEEGRLADAASRLERLAETVDRVGGPVSSWLRDRCIACIAQGRGDLELAASAGQRGYDRMHTVEPEATHGAYLAIQCAISHHRGATDTGLALARAPFSSQAIFTTMRRTGRAFLLARAGQLEAAATEYEHAGPVSTWRFPPFYVLPGIVVGALAAAALDRNDDLRALVEQIEPFRGQHVVGGAGVVTFLGPVELHLGAFSLQLGQVDAAIDDLTAAERMSEQGGATGYLAEARHHLARALLARGAPGDIKRAAALADASARTIHALGLHALAAHNAALPDRIGPGAAVAVLSPREEEVAALVAQGLTNPQIAERLVISARTAQNHVQHILTKLGFRSRSQIASWKTRSSR
jgi:DNA-binding CsgD family transcriptional regulator